MVRSVFQRGSHEAATESLINSLSKIPSLRVIPRSLVFRYKGQEIDPLAVGKELNVRAVLTGRVGLRGENLILGAELMDVASVSQLWGDQYNRKMTDIFAVQEGIVRDISGQLQLKLTAEDGKFMRRRRSRPAFLISH